MQSNLVIIAIVLAIFYKWLHNEFSKQPVGNLINARAEFIDRLLIKLFHVYDLAREPDLALIAVGGYGRGELHPYSDIDFLLLVTKPPSEEICEKNRPVCHHAMGSQLRDWPQRAHDRTSHRAKT